MKIIALRLKNLHSLKGEFAIDFTHPTLAESGIFAITGPTGAGKSTLLDAITLALYSYTPRLEEITKGGIESNNILVTQGTSDGYAELVFEVNQQKYMANWSISKNRNGNWNEYKHQLSIQDAASDWKQLTDKRTDTKARINEIIGLTKEQFSKAIVLSQGKFDDFLTAKEKDRYKLLEIITGTGLYREIGKKVYEKYKEARDAYAFQESKKSNITLLSDAEIAGITEELTKFSSDLDSLEKDTKRISVQLEKRIELTEINNRLESESATLANLIQEESSLAPSLQKLTAYEKAVLIKPSYSEWQMITEAGTEQVNKIERKKAEINTLLNLEANYITQLAEQINKSINKDSFLIELDAFTTKVASLDREIELLKSTIDSYKASNRKLYNTLPDSLQEKITPYLKINQDGLGKWIQEQKAVWTLNIPQGILAVDYFTNQIALQTGTLELLKELRYPAENIPQLENKNQELVLLKSQLEEAQTKLIGLHKQVSNTLVQEETLLEQIQLELNRFREMHQLESTRSKLRSGEPCPCCGSTNHPYLLDMPVISSVIEKEFEEKVTLVANLQSTKIEAERELQGQTNTIENAARDIKNNEDSISNILKKATDILQKTGIYKMPSPKNLQVQISEMEAAIEKSKASLLWAEKEASLYDILEGLTKQLQNEQLFHKKQQERILMFNTTPLDTIQNTLRNNWVINETKLSAAYSSQELLAQEEKKIASKITELAAKVNEALTAAEFTSMEAFKSALVPESVAAEWKQQINTLAKRRVAAETDLKSLQERKETVTALIHPEFDNKNLDELLQTLNNQKTQILENRGKIQQQLADNEKAKETHTSLMAELQRLHQRQHLFSKLNDLIGDAGGDTFNKIVQRITLKQLLALANSRMENLMPRYRLLITFDKSKNEDQIWVADLFMGNETRSINSVSGGERFVISLALALALSDMASQNIRIDSLFIDEGFGSLSPDELNNAIQMLERMQLEGNKMLGIISHVESLKERITTQLVVEKIGPGESTLFLSTPEMKISLRAQK
jgi:exonuclease SbcC